MEPWSSVSASEVLAEAKLIPSHFHYAALQRASGIRWRLAEWAERATSNWTLRWQKELHPLDWLPWMWTMSFIWVIITSNYFYKFTLNRLIFKPIKNFEVRFTKVSLPFPILDGHFLIENLDLKLSKWIALIAVAQANSLWKLNSDKFLLNVLVPKVFSRLKTRPPN